MAKQKNLSGLNELREHLSGLNESKSVFILFTGNKDEGKSWCPDCNVAEPVINESLQFLGEDSEFITCFVGDRPT